MTPASAPRMSGIAAGNSAPCSSETTFRAAGVARDRPRHEADEQPEDRDGGTPRAGQPLRQPGDPPPRSRPGHSTSATHRASTCQVPNEKRSPDNEKWKIDRCFERTPSANANNARTPEHDLRGNRP